MSAARYAIGVDLGTTHCALSYVDLEASDGEKAAQQVLAIPQLTAPGTVEDRPLLPSFLYLPHADELASGDLGLPWTTAQDHAVGEFARRRGAATPIRLVASAKSWLCHPGVDRRADILPAEAPAEVARISPLTASVRYLSHLRAAWNAAHPDSPFDAQDITVTIPASFDPAARELTAEAAQLAGYPHITLLEEPQAALYSWIQRSAGQWRKDVKRGDLAMADELVHLEHLDVILALGGEGDDGVAGTEVDAYGVARHGSGGLIQRWRRLARRRPLRFHRRAHRTAPSSARCRPPAAPRARACRSR